MKILNLLKKLFFTPKKPRVQIGLGAADAQEVAKKWAEIEQLIGLGSPSNFKTAILEADKLLDHVLKLYGYRGQTMGERMKSIPREKYSREFFDNMWQAHKLRNEMVHNLSYEVQAFEASSAVNKFKKTLQSLGVL